MNYKLYKEVNPEFSALQQVLCNRGISIEKQEQWLNAGWDDINDWRLFGEIDMRLAASRIVNIIQNNKEIGVIWDADPDGASSGAIISNFIYAYWPQYIEDEHLHIYQHQNRAHGLSDMDLNKIIEECDLLWIPDAGSNDHEQHQILDAAGVEVIITDHHLADRISEYAIVINNQLSDYPNKQMSGAGVTWQLCRCIEELFFPKNQMKVSKSLLDLCAFGNISDMMDYTELEIRAIVNLGLSNLQNPFLKGIAEKHDYSIQKMNGLNYYSCAFYLTPYLNCCFRSATQEEKEFVLSAMLEQNRNKFVLTSKRGHKGEQVPLWEEAVLVAERVKRKQTQILDETMELFEQKIQKENLLDNSILLITCEPNEIEKNLQGLLANKYQAKYQRPCAILTYQYDTDSGQEFYRGSMRNYSLSERQNLKKDLEDTGKIEWCQGHENSAGLSIAANDIEDFITSFNKEYENVDQTPTYWVDYIWNKNTIDSSKILEIGAFNIYGQEIPESLVCVRDIALSPQMITLMGVEKGHPTIKIQIGDVSIIKFKSSQKEYEEFCEDRKVLTVIGKCVVNEWQGKITPQIIVENFELREDWVF